MIPESIFEFFVTRDSVPDLSDIKFYMNFQSYKHALYCNSSLILRYKSKRIWLLPQKQIENGVILMCQIWRNF